MALESATYIYQLDQNAPDGLDRKSEGDDHMRMIKRTLKNTFPNLLGATQISNTQLDQLAAPGAYFKTGMTQMWYGLETEVPAGWLICNGANGTPNMVGRIPMGSGPWVAHRATTGSEKPSWDLSVTTTVAGHALTEAQLPPHSHGSYGPTPGIAFRGGNDALSEAVKPQQTTLTGSGQAHSHGATSQGRTVEKVQLPPVLGLHFIMKS